MFRTLEQKGFDVAYLRERRRITLLRREAPAGTTLSDIEDVFAAAVRAGAPAIRYLGNPGLGKALLPGAGIDDVLELEAKVTALAKRDTAGRRLKKARNSVQAFAIYCGQCGAPGPRVNTVASQVAVP